MPESSGCSVSIMPCVARCTIRCRPSRPLIAFDRQALKSVTIVPLPAGVIAMIASASCRVPGRREKLVLTTRGVSAVNDCARVPVVKLCVALNRGSSLAKTGSAIMTTSFAADPTSIPPRRIAARVEADGKLTIS